MLISRVLKHIRVMKSSTVILFWFFCSHITNLYVVDAVGNFIALTAYPMYTLVLYDMEVVILCCYLWIIVVIEDCCLILFFYFVFLYAFRVSLFACVFYVVSAPLISLVPIYNQASAAWTMVPVSAPNFRLQVPEGSTDTTIKTQRNKARALPNVLLTVMQFMV